MLIPVLGNFYFLLHLHFCRVDDCHLEPLLQLFMITFTADPVSKHRSFHLLIFLTFFLSVITRCPFWAACHQSDFLLFFFFTKQLYSLKWALASRTVLSTHGPSLPVLHVQHFKVPLNILEPTSSRSPSSSRTERVCKYLLRHSILRHSRNMS